MVNLSNLFFLSQLFHEYSFLIVIKIQYSISCLGIPQTLLARTRFIKVKNTEVIKNFYLLWKTTTTKTTFLFSFFVNLLESRITRVRGRARSQRHCLTLVFVSRVIFLWIFFLLTCRFTFFFKENEFLGIRCGR